MIESFYQERTDWEWSRPLQSRWLLLSRLPEVGRMETLHRSPHSHHVQISRSQLRDWSTDPVVGDEEWTSPLTLRTITVIYISNHQKYFQSWCWGQEGWLGVRQDNKAITKYLVAGRQGIMDCLITRPDRIQVAWLVFAALFKCRDCLSNLQTEPN